MADVNVFQQMADADAAAAKVNPQAKAPAEETQPQSDNVFEQMAKPDPGVLSDVYHGVKSGVMEDIPNMATKSGAFAGRAVSGLGRAVGSDSLQEMGAAITARLKDATVQPDQADAQSIQGQDGGLIRRNMYGVGKGLGAMGAAAGGGAAAGAAIGSILPGVGTAIGALAGAGIGMFMQAVGSGGAQAEDTAENVVATSKKAGMSDADAENRGLEAGAITGTITTGSQLILNKIGLGEMAKPFVTKLGSAAADSLVKTTLEGGFMNAAKGTAKAALEGGAVNVGTAASVQGTEAGFGSGEGPTAQGLIDAAVQGVGTTAVAHAGGATLSGVRARANKSVLTDVDAPIESRANAMLGAAAVISAKDSSVGKDFALYAQQQIVNGLPVEIGPDSMYKGFADAIRQRMSDQDILKSAMADAAKRTTGEDFPSFRPTGDEAAAANGPIVDQGFVPGQKAASGQDHPEMVTPDLNRPMPDDLKAPVPPAPVDQTAPPTITESLSGIFASKDENQAIDAFAEAVGGSAARAIENMQKSPDFTRVQTPEQAEAVPSRENLVAEQQFYQGQQEAAAQDLRNQAFDQTQQTPAVPADAAAQNQARMQEEAQRMRDQGHLQGEQDLAVPRAEEAAQRQDEHVAEQDQTQAAVAKVAGAGEQPQSALAQALSKAQDRNVQRLGKRNLERLTTDELGVLAEHHPDPAIQAQAQKLFDSRRNRPLIEVNGDQRTPQEQAQQASNVVNQWKPGEPTREPALSAIDKAANPEGFGGFPGSGDESGVQFSKQRVGNDETSPVAGTEGVKSTPTSPEVAPARATPPELRPLATAMKSIGLTHGIVGVDKASLPDARTPANNGIKGATTLSKKEAAMLEKSAAVFGKKVVLFREDGVQPGHSTDGMMLPHDPNTIYINADASAAHHLVVAGHELAHQMQQDAPHLYKTLQDAVIAHINKGGLTQYKKYYPDEGSLKDPAVRQRVTDEFVADLVGNRFGEYRTWQQVFAGASKENRSLVYRIADFVTSFIDKLLGNTKFKQFATDDMVSNLTAVRTSVRRALADYANEQGGKSMQHEADQLRARTTNRTEGTVGGKRLVEPVADQNRADVGKPVSKAAPAPVAERAAEPTQGTTRMEQTGTPRTEGVKQSPERTDPQTDSPEFKKWFGDSKMVDAEGKPLVVYHGTPYDFNAFTPREGTRHGFLGAERRVNSPAFFFTESRELAHAYGRNKQQGSKDAYFLDAKAMPVYLRMENPLDLTRKTPVAMRILEKAGYAAEKNDTAADLWRVADEPSVVKALQDMGYDGLKLNEATAAKDMGVKGRPTSYAVFDSNQVKSATGNNGKFDASSPDIRMSPERADLTENLKKIDAVTKSISSDEALKLVAGKTGKPTGVDPAVWFKGDKGTEEYRVGKVPLDLFRANEDGAAYDGTVDMRRAQGYAEMNPADAPPVIGVISKRTADGMVNIIDGGHRITAARLRGDDTINAIIRVKRENVDEQQRVGSPEGGNDQAAVPAGSAAADAVSRSGIVRGSASWLAEQGRAHQGNDLSGLPSRVTVPGLGAVDFHSFKPAQDAAHAYAAEHGIKYDPPKTYAKVDPERATRIAQEFERMKDDPTNPEVKAAYEAMSNETVAQYEAALKAGLKVEFIKPGQEDPYAASPRLAILDIVHNNHMWVFSTKDGYGSDNHMDPNNPMLRESGHMIGDQPALVNDLFRVVHDYFGHVKEGIGFRADGEENAWRSHIAMYSDLAGRAATTETRGQNSWVNFGPYAEANKTAKGADTHFAEQKVGLMPEWVSQEARGDAEPATRFGEEKDAATVNPLSAEPQVRRSGERANYLGKMDAAQEAAAKNVGMMKPQETYKQKMDRFKQDLGKRMQQGIVDQFAPIKYIDQHSYMQARMSKGTDGTLEASMLYGVPFLRDGVFDVDVKGKGFAKIMSQLDGEHGRFFLWVAAMRAEELKKPTAEFPNGRENLFSDQDISALKTLDQPDGTHQQRAQKFKDTLKEYNDFNDGILKIAEQAGILSAEDRQLFKDQPYVPFYRAMDAEKGGGMTGPGAKSSGLVNQYAFKKLKGGKEQLNEDLLANTLQNWSHLLAASSRNMAARSTMEAAAKLGVARELTTVKQQMGAENNVRVRVNGKDVHYEVDDPHLLSAIAAMSSQVPPWMKSLSTFKRLLTGAVTIMPGFKVRNLIRDSIASIALGEMSPNIPGNWIQGAKALQHDNQTYASMLASGGIIRMGSMLDGNEAERAHRLIAKGVDKATILDKSGTKMLFDKARDLFDVYQELGDKSENINRAALYEQLLTKKNPDGSAKYNHAEAAFMSRDMMDFSMQGSWPVIRFLTQSVPFMNARMQGLYKLGRAGVEHPARVAAVVGSVMMASLYLQQKYQDDPDWKRREDWDRDNYWWFKVGGTAFRIPKPFEIGATGTIAERTWELMNDKEMTGKRYGGRIADIIGQQFALNPTPQIVKPLMDVYANKDGFTGRTIESPSMQALQPEDRYGPNTSMTARFLGQLGLPDPVQLIQGRYSPISPVQAESLLRGYFGSLGALALGATDMIARPLTGQPDAPSRPWTQMTGGMIDDLSQQQSRYVTTMYDNLSSIEQAYNSYHTYLKTGQLDKAAAEMKANRGLITSYGLAESAKRTLSSLTLQEKRIVNSTMLSADTKRERLNDIAKRKDAIAQRITTAELNRQQQ